MTDCDHARVFTLYDPDTGRACLWACFECREKFVPFTSMLAELDQQRVQMVSDGWRQCAAGSSITHYCALLEVAVQAEREACAQLCETEPVHGSAALQFAFQRLAERIRARHSS